MKYLILIMALLGSSVAFAKCKTFGEAMNNVADDLTRTYPRHGPIAMSVSAGGADVLSSDLDFEVIAVFEDESIVKVAGCRFKGAKACTFETCKIDHATMYP